jgi:soluble lytic murein transglycosylase-like protein
MLRQLRENLVMIRALLVLWIALACNTSAHAMYVCIDEWGRSYTLHHPAGEGLLRFKCYEEGTPPPRPSEEPVTERPVAESLIDEVKSAALALGLTRPPDPVLKSRGGGLAVVDTAPSPYSAALAPIGRVRAYKAGSSMEQMIAGVARKYGHDVNLLKAIIHVESRFNPNALSPKGAIGLMQVMPTTGSRVGIEQPKRNLFDPEMNLHAGARYLRILLDMFSDRPELAIAAYNAGEGAVMRYKRAIPPYPETQSYVRQVMAQYRYYQSL